MSHPCWFCGKKEGEMVFDGEFDTPVHVECIKKELASGNPEAEFMSYLLEEE